VYLIFFYSTPFISTLFPQTSGNKCFFFSNGPEGERGLVKTGWVNKTLLCNDILLYCSKKLHFTNFACYARVCSLLSLYPSQILIVYKIWYSLLLNCLFLFLILIFLTGLVPKIRGISGNSPNVVRTLMCTTVDHYASTYGDKGWGCGYRYAFSKHILSNLMFIRPCIILIVE